jgi:hypothetical protein
MVSGNNALRSSLRTDETRNLRKGKKVQKEPNPPPPPKKMQLKKKKKQKKQEEVDVELDEEGFAVYDPSLFPYVEFPEWLDIDEE